MIKLNNVIKNEIIKDEIENGKKIVNNSILALELMLKEAKNAKEYIDAIEAEDTVYLKLASTKDALNLIVGIANNAPYRLDVTAAAKCMGSVESLKSTILFIGHALALGDIQ